MEEVLCCRGKFYGVYGERALGKVAEMVDRGTVVAEGCNHLFGNRGGVCRDVFLADAVFSGEDDRMDCVEFGRRLFLPNGKVFCDAFEFSE